MKRFVTILLVLFVLLTALPADAAGESARFISPAYAFSYDSVARIQATVPRDGAVYVIRTESGKELSRAEGRGGGTLTEFFFAADRSLGRHTVLQLFRENEPEVLSETNLFLDERHNEGIRKVERSDKKIALTFDAAIADAHTVKIMDLLEQYGGRATFFVIGMFAEAHPDLCREMTARGHELASHSYEHLEMPDAEAGRAYKSLKLADDAIRSVNGDRTILYRPPSGISSFRDRAIARGLGSEVILWEVDSGDGFKNLSLGTILNRTKPNLHNGGIVLMHVYGPWTLQALAELLPYYAEQGYEFVTVSDLLLKEESFIDGTGMQRPALHDGAFFDENYRARFRKTKEIGAVCKDGHVFTGDICEKCGYKRIERLNGTGNAAMQCPALGEGLYRIHIRNAAGRRFQVWQTDGDKYRILAANGSVYDGSVLAMGESPFTLEIESVGPWSLEPEQIKTTESRTFSGTGDTVTDLAFLPKGDYRFSCSDRSHFVVRMYTESGEKVLVNRPGPCEIVVPVADAEEGAFFCVLTDGAWKIGPAS